MENRENLTDEPLEKSNRGAHNLLILGVFAVAIALVTSVISLFIYHNSGDIYLDCSLPEADCPSARAGSEENDRNKAYTFQDFGEINEKVLDKYLKEIKATSERIKKTINSHDNDALSDESLGI